MTATPHQVMRLEYAVIARLWSRHRVSASPHDGSGLLVEASDDGSELLVADLLGVVPAERTVPRRFMVPLPVALSIAIPPGLLERGPLRYGEAGDPSWERECEALADALHAEMERRAPGKWRGRRRRAVR